jgi:hypothetical protein
VLGWCLAINWNVVSWKEDGSMQNPPLLPWERTKKWPKEDTEHEIQTSDKLIWWCFRVLRASPAAAATTTTRGVSHCGLPIYIKKSIKANEELWKTQIFHHPKIYLIFKKSSKRNQNSFKILL